MLFTCKVCKVVASARVYLQRLCFSARVCETNRLKSTGNAANTKLQVKPYRFGGIDSVQRLIRFIFSPLKNTANVIRHLRSLTFVLYAST